MHAKMNRAKRKRNAEILQNSIKLQEEMNKIMFRTTIAKGIRTGSFSNRDFRKKNK